MRKQKHQKRAQNAALILEAGNLPESSSLGESNSRNLVQNPPEKCYPKMALNSARTGSSKQPTCENDIKSSAKAREATTECGTNTAGTLSMTEPLQSNCIGSTQPGPGHHFSHTAGNPNTPLSAQGLEITLSGKKLQIHPRCGLVPKLAGNNRLHTPRAGKKHWILQPW